MDVTQAVREGTIKSMHQAASYYVKYGTLHNHVLGIGDRHQGHQHQQLLSDA